MALSKLAHSITYSAISSTTRTICPWHTATPLHSQQLTQSVCSVHTKLVPSTLGGQAANLMSRATGPRQQSVCRAVSSEAAPSSYSRHGPYSYTELVPVNIKVGGDAELPITAQIQVTVPIGGPKPAPLVLLSAGFLLNASLYSSYAQHLASWGYAVALYDVSEVMDDKETVYAIQRILDTCTKGAKLSPHISNQGAVLVGHSRGAKLSCLAAAEEPAARIRALVLLDPVDNTPMTPAGGGYPSALPGLMKCTGPPRNLPVLVIGAGSGGDVVPESANYKLFASASRGPLWNCELKGAGHLGFLDKQIGLFSLFSAPGSTPDEAVRAASKVALLTWLRHVAFPVPGALPCAAAIEQARVAMSGLVRGEMTSACYRLEAVRTQQQQGGNTTSSYSQPRTTSSSAPPPPARGQKPLLETYESLMGRRAKELKAMLVERNIPCSDCFEKEQLAKRLIEACGVAASTR